MVSSSEECAGWAITESGRLLSSFALCSDGTTLDVASITFLLLFLLFFVAFVRFFTRWAPPVKPAFLLAQVPAFWRARAHAHSPD
jgi:hypothetical protein